MNIPDLDDRDRAVLDALGTVKRTTKMPLRGIRPRPGPLRAENGDSTGSLAGQGVRPGNRRPFPATFDRSFLSNPD